MSRFCWLVLWLAAAPALAQQRDAVHYRDRTAKPERTAEFVGAVVSDTINGVRVKPQVGPERTFAAADIVDVIYAPPRALEIPYQPILAGESAVRTGAANRARVTQLIKDYATFQGNLKDAKAPGLRRHIPYRLVMLRASLAEKREDKLEVVSELDKVRKDVAESWQFMPVTRLLVQLLADLDRLDDASRVLDEAVKTPELAREVKQELELTLIDLMIRSGKASDVEGRINAALQALPAGDVMATKLKIFQIGARAGKDDTDKLVTQLKTIIEQAQETSIKALAYNTLGDCLSAKGLKEDAKWAYLWVDVVYNQDKAEHAKAVDRLARVFKDLNDEQRADKYRDKLKSLR